MKATLLTQIKSPLVVADIEPMPCQYGQVLVCVLVSGICGAQLQEIDGHKPSGPMPHPLGHEGCGIVEDIGEGVKTVKHGDKVVLHWRKGDGLESDFPSFKCEGGLITGGKVTTFSEKTVISENRCTAVPMDTPDELCALMGCSLSTALGVIENEASVKFGERVLIIGCGGLGLNLILASKMAQASHIVATDIHEIKGAAAFNSGVHAFGFRHAIGSTFDVIIDTTGDIQAIENALPLLAASGRFIMVGQPKPNAGFIVHNARHFFEGEGKTIKATQGGCFNPSRDIPRYVAMWKAGILKTDAIVSHRVSLSNINEGIDLVRNGMAGRVMVVCNG